MKTLVRRCGQSKKVSASYSDLPDLNRGFFTCGKYIDQEINIPQYFTDEILKVLKGSI